VLALSGFSGTCQTVSPASEAASLDLKKIAEEKIATKREIPTTKPKSIRKTVLASILF